MRTERENNDCAVFEKKIFFHSIVPRGAKSPLRVFPYVFVGTIIIISPLVCVR